MRDEVCPEKIFLELDSDADSRDESDNENEYSTKPEVSKSIE